MPEVVEDPGSRVVVEQAGGVGIVTLSNPRRRNSLSRQNWFELAHRLAELGEDDTVRAIVITGEGDAFCSGVDLRSRGANPRPADPVIHRSLQELRRCPKPTIAAVEGAAVAAGWSLALAADLVIAGESAFFEVPFPARGMQPGAGVLWYLSRRLSPAQLTAMMWRRERYNATRARQTGLVNEVVTAGRARERAVHIAQELAALPAATLSITKTILRRTAEPLGIALDGDRLDYAANALAYGQAPATVTDSSPQAVAATRVGTVAHIVVPPDSSGWTDLASTVRDLTDDPSVRAIVLAGGPSSFDHRTHPAEAGMLAPASQLSPVHRAIEAVYACTKLTVAAVEGDCTGPGWALALACDLVVAGASACFRAPDPAAGQLPGSAIGWFLARRLDHHELCYLLWCAHSYPADAALAKGLVSEVVADGEADRMALAIADRVAAESAAGKAMLRRGAAPYLESAVDSG